MAQTSYTYRPSGPVRALPWAGEALCVGADPDVFTEPDQVAEAIRVCSHCPVAVDCLRHALADKSLCGVWGGTTQTQRARMRALKAKQADA